jgi:hypothetical protein
MLTYENILNSNNDVLAITVKLEKRVIGKILIEKFVCDKTYETKKTFQYFPKGSKEGSEKFPNLRALQRSLEEE